MNNIPNSIKNILSKNKNKNNIKNTKNSKVNNIKLNNNNNINNINNNNNINNINNNNNINNRKGKGNNYNRKVKLNTGVKKNFVIPGFIKVILIIIVILVILYFCYLFITDYYNSFTNKPYLIEGITDGTKALTLPGSNIKESKDGRYGREFSYSFWIFIKNANYGYTTETDCNAPGKGNKHIFHKGSYVLDKSCGAINTESEESGNIISQNTNSQNISGENKNRTPVLQYPGVWLNSRSNELIFCVNTQEDSNSQVTISNVPVDKWVHISLILINNNVDIYVNCNLKKRHTFSSVPKINYGNMYITHYGGFLGYLSKLRYYNYALEPYSILNLCKINFF